MSNTKKTAVEWLIDQIAEKQNGKGSSISMDEIFEQAQQMEKEQIMEAHNQGYADGYRDSGTSPIGYYTQTYQAFKGELIQDEIGNLKPKKNEQ